jgi:hypothetical protein
MTTPDWLADERARRGDVTPQYVVRAEAMMQAADIAIWELELLQPQD